MSNKLQTSDFDYPLDEDLIAQSPLQQRDQSRLMVLKRKAASISHHIFAELPSLLQNGDLLVLNNTSVIPAKFNCCRSTGGNIKGLFCSEPSKGVWQVLLKNAGRCKAGEQLALRGCDDVKIILAENLGQGLWKIRVSPPDRAEKILQEAGATPLPPYIHRAGLEQDREDRLRYQTVYASQPGAIAAPTAGLHFTKELLDALGESGIETANITLHVGLGTFAPVKSDLLCNHKMHSEWYEIDEETANKLNAARSQQRRIVAVGTTSARVLETAAVKNNNSDSSIFVAQSGWTDLFLYPPADFQAVDVLITNFHLPKSTLLMLVAAFCSPGSSDGTQMILNAYAEAIEMRYRFYSYGDAMLIE